MAKASDSLKTASVLAFERKLATSDALMYAGSWEGSDWRPIKILDKAVRGTISNRLKKAVASDADIQKANLQRVDSAALPADADTLKVSFTLRVLGNLSTPSVCNDRAYQHALEQIIDGYSQTHGFDELARRYASNLANGRFLWRNRVGAEQVSISVSSGDKTWTFNAWDYSLRDFNAKNDAITALAQEIKKGLSGESYVLLKINARVRLGAGQEVFPSQELVLDTNSNKSRLLYQVGEVAAMHSQKIGNALRTIDTWHPEADALGAIAVEPYGSVTSRGIACRQPVKKLDFYSLLDNWVIKGVQPDVDQQHYVMAIFIRGGVFGEKGD